MSGTTKRRADPGRGRTMSQGADLLPNGSGVQFRVWAPEHTRVELVLEQEQEQERRIPLTPSDDGYWTVNVDEAGPGTLYRYALDRAAQAYPDPASRFQPSGPFGPSEVTSPASFAWTDDRWQGVELTGQVLYEMHVGSFTPHGTWAAATAKLEHLRELGVSVIEVMPVAGFPGEFGWGYDGVNLYAPQHHYGRPDDFRTFVDVAHGLGLGVILDVVYNHFGPAGSNFKAFSEHYFGRRDTEWGRALNFDGPQSRPVRDFICDNACYWIREFHLDGLRLDATQSMFDDSDEHVITELTRRARAEAGPRSILLIAENEPQNTRLLHDPARGGQGLDAIWNDDFHHSATVALLGRREAYCTDYLGRAQELVAAVRHGTIYQGQYYAWQKKRRGSSTAGLAPHRFIAYLENHDQVANSARGARSWQQAHPGAYRAMTAFWLLGPWTPMFFQGQEWATPRPFVFFADHDASLALAVRHGRGEFLAQFPSFASRAVQDGMPDPGARSTFESTRLDWNDSRTSAHGAHYLALHRDLLHLRRHDPVLTAAGHRGEAPDAAVISDACLVVRWSGAEGADRLLAVNLGVQHSFRPAPEPLLAPPSAASWQLAWSSEEPRYGGSGTPERALDEHGWDFPGYAALLFFARHTG